MDPAEPAPMINTRWRSLLGDRRLVANSRL
jgi:hypothetical protein